MSKRCRLVPAFEKPWKKKHTRQQKSRKVPGSFAVVSCSWHMRKSTGLVYLYSTPEGSVIMNPVIRGHYTVFLSLPFSSSLVKF